MIGIMSRGTNETGLNSATSNVSNSVDVFDDCYYNINKRILCFTGLWPYQSLFERVVRVSIIVVMSFSLLVPQMLKLVQSWDMGEVGVFIECLSPVVANIGCSIKLLTSILHTQEIRRFLDAIRDDWKCARYMPELKILQEHGRTGRRYTISYFTMVYMAVAAWTAVPLTPIVMDIVAPLNESRPYVQFFQTDYRVDPDKYFYPILIHGIVTTSVGIGVFVAVDTAFMVFAQHACAMMDIVRYRLENMVQEDEGTSIRPYANINGDFYYQQVVTCLIKHKRSIEYNCRWYLMSPRSQKLIVLFIRRSLEPCTIVAGKMYVMSLENFRCALQTSLSYLTLLTSMQ